MTAAPTPRERPETRDSLGRDLFLAFCAAEYIREGPVAFGPDFAEITLRRVSHAVANAVDAVEALGERP